MTPYIGYPNVQGIIYQDELSRNRLMRTDELHKMDYLTNETWSPETRRRAQVMISAIDRKLRDRRLMCNLEKFVGGRPVNSFTMKMEILLEPASNKLMVEHAEFDESNANVLERFYTSAGNPVKEILLKLNLPDHRILKDGGEDFRYSDTERLSRSDEVLKLKNFKKDATLKLSKSTNQEWYEHVGPEVTRSQDDKVTRWRNEIMLG
ncbi:hypothetical protein Tco_0410282 [Tanacetum coccineum]